MLKDPIIVTGCPRSGTSLVMGVLHRCGMQTGTICGPTKWNPKGQYENREIINNVDKALLNKMGCDPKGQYPLPDPKKTIIDFPVYETIAKIAQKQEIDVEDDWGFKDAKCCLTWPAMAEAFPNAKWVIVRRNKEAIINSCFRVPFMDKYDTHEGWSSWADYHIDRFKEIKASQQAIEIWPEQDRNGNLLVFKDLVRWLGLKWNEESVREFVDFSLYTHHE